MSVQRESYDLENAALSFLSGLPNQCFLQKWDANCYIPYIYLCCSKHSIKGCKIAKIASIITIVIIS